MFVDVVEETFRHTFLHDFAETFDQRNGSVVFGQGVVRSVRFRDDDNQRVAPELWVMSNVDACVGNGGHVFVDDGPGVFHDLPGDTGDSGG